jgi:hypothetical protein
VAGRGRAARAGQRDQPAVVSDVRSDEETRAATTAWLLDGDPAVRWQVGRDLLDEPEQTVAAERAKVASAGWGARLLSHQDAAGTWGGVLYSPKWTSTTYTLLLLRQLGLPADNAGAQAGCRTLLDGARWYGGGLNLAASVREPETCITAIVVSLAAAFRCADERAEGAVSWLLGQQLPDGGWNCETVRSGSRHGSFHTSILTLEALAEWHAAGLGTEEVTAAATRGRTFFADHRLYCSHRTGAVVDPQLTRMVFPPGWHHDLLRGLDHFQAADAPRDERLGGAVERLRSRQRADGSWVLNARYPGRYWFELERAGQPSRMNTLRALRVLRWWERGEAT